MPFGGMVQVLGGLATDKATSAEGVHRLGTLGAWYMSPDGQTLLRLVQNGDGSALTQYAAVAWKNPAAGTVSVTGTTAARDPQLAGVVQSAIAASGFGFIAVSGITEALAAAAVTIDTNIEIDGTDGKWDDSAADAADMKNAWAVDTGVADTQFTILLKGLL